MSICEFLFSSDMINAKVEQTLGALMGRIGLPKPPPEAAKQFPAGGWDIVFAPVNPNTKAAPTRIEIMAPLSLAPGMEGRDVKPDYGLQIYEAQKQRKWRTHATVVVTSELDAVVARARELNLRHWFQTPPDHPGFPRLWVGIPNSDHKDYQPDDDCGLMLEFIPFGASAFSVTEVDTAPDLPHPGEVGMRRVQYRDFLVRDVDACVQTLSTNFGWKAAGPVADDPARGHRIVTMSANYRQGARLRLVEPTNPDLQPARDMAAEGPGPYTITIAVFDLEATAADLESRGTPFDRLPATPHAPETLVILDTELGAPFHLIPDGSA